MKFPFFLASACLISYGLINPGSVQANAFNIRPAALASETASPPSAAPDQARRNKAGIEEADSKPPGDQGGNSGIRPPQAGKVGEELGYQRARSFLLLLQILRSAK